MNIVQHLPGMKMARFGLRPNGEPLYRVVFSDSRTSLAGGRWPDGVCEYREMPLYDDHAWVLEKWRSAVEFAGTREEYHREQYDADSGLLTLGPYPFDGEWQFVYTFPFQPIFSMIAIVVKGEQETAKLSPQEQMRGIMDPMLARRARQHQRIDDIFDESQNAFKNASAISGPGNRPINSKRNRRVDDIRFKYGAEDLGLPMSDNAFFTGESPDGKPASNAR